jgi:hypothetical protein
MKILVKEEWVSVIKEGNKRFPFDENHYRKREEFRTGISWHIPSDELINAIKEYSPIVSVASGFGYTESLAIKEGADVIATDVSPNKNNKWCSDGIFNTQVEEISAIDAVKKYSGRNVFMAWPPYDTSMAFDAASEMDIEKVLIYVGESYGGCTGNDDFFQYLETHFEELDISVNIPRWCGIYDEARVYKKIKE